MSTYFIFIIFSVVLLSHVKTVHPHPAAVNTSQENNTNAVTLDPAPSIKSDDSANEKIDAFNTDSHPLEVVSLKPLRLRRSIHLPYGKPGMSDQPIRDLEAILSGDYKGKDLLRLLATFVPNDQVYDPYYNYEEDVIDLVSSRKKPGSIVSIAGASKPIPAASTPLSDTISLMKSGIVGGGGSPLLAMSSSPDDDGENDRILPLLTNKVVMKHNSNSFPSFHDRSTNSPFYSKRSITNNQPPQQERIQFTILPNGKLALTIREPGEPNRYILLSFPQHLFADGIPVIQRAIL